MDVAALRKVNEARRARQAVILVTDFADGSSRVISETESIEGTLGEAVAAAFRTGRSAAVNVDGKALFFTVHLPRPRLVVIGAVHISQALTPMATAAGYDVEIIDPRTAFATPERFPDRVLKAEWPEDALFAAPLDAHCALAALTHDPKIDDYPLRSALESGCFYVGALGSRKTHAKRLDRLRESGVDEAKLARIRAPIGLYIGASSPAEIAVAVLAEVISTYRSRGREGPPR